MIIQLPQDSQEEFPVRLMTQERATELNSGGATQITLNRQGNSSGPTRAVVNSFLTPIKDEKDADAVDIKLGRILTHEEMVSVEQKIAETDEAFGCWPGIAALTTKDGLVLLNVSLGKITPLQLKDISISIRKLLNAKEFNLGKNTLVDTSYIA
jgi:hypothetical protein